MAAIKQLVNSLHSSLGIAEFQYQHHSWLLARRNELLVKLGEMKIIKERLTIGISNIDQWEAVCLAMVARTMVDRTKNPDSTQNYQVLTFCKN